MATALKPIARRALAAQSDQRLVLLLREGHEPAFDEIVSRYRGALVAFAAAIAGAGNAEDVVQAALIRAHAALRADGREIRLRPWLFAIVRNGALNAVRDDPAWSELDPELHRGGETTATAEQREELERLVDAICALPESQRRALVMREMEGVGHAEIATKLGTSATAVRGLIFRARTTLRNSLGALLPLPVLRWLLEDAATVGTAGAAAGGAAAGGGGILAGGGALGGGALGKVAIGFATAIVAIGAGKAIDDRRSGDERPEAGPASASTATGGGSGDGSSVAGGAAAGSKAMADHRERGEDRREAGEEAREERGGDRDDDGGERRDDDREDSSPAPEGRGGGDDDDRPPGGSSVRGDGADDDEPEPDEPEEPEVDDDEPEVDEPELEESEIDDDGPDPPDPDSDPAEPESDAGTGD